MTYRILLLFAGGLAALPCFAAEPTKLLATLAVKSGEHERLDARVFCKLPESLLAQKNLRLIETTSGRSTTVPIQPDTTLRGLWWIAAGKTEPATARTYRLESGESPATETVTVLNTDEALEARAGNKTLLRYNKQHVEPPPAVDSRFGRSGHLHPVQTLGGAVVSDELPPDHLHQSGLFLSYTRALFEGREVDFWNLAAGKGRVRFKTVLRTTSGSVFGEFQTEQEHVDLTTEIKNAESNQSELGKTSGGKVALREQWIARIWQPSFATGYWVLDIHSQQECATDSPLVLPEYHYGGMAIRAAREWTPGKVTFLTSEGDNRIKGNHTRPRWCDIRGEVAGQPAGIALMTHPANFRFPEPLRIHPTMPYMVYTPQFLGAWEISPGKLHHANYRFAIHDGTLTAPALDRIWRDFAEPLTANLE